MPHPATGRYTTRFATSETDVNRAQRLRYKAFRGGEGLDRDAFDPLCKHVLVEDASGALVCTYRLFALNNGGEIGRSYSAQFYDLSALQDIKGMMVEVGRFCIDPGLNDPDILRIAWGQLTEFVDKNNVELLFGCTSFTGTEVAEYTDAFALLKEKYLAPKPRLPKIKAPQVFDFSTKLRLKKPDLKQARLRMPPLLRTYLSMGGWVSDHAVVDDDLNTLHVFTGLEIAAIPASRKRLLRAVV